MGKKMYYIDLERKQRNTAGKKAPADIAEICRRQKMIRVPMPMSPSNRSELFRKMWLAFTVTPNWAKLSRKVESGDIIIYQHPMYGKRITMRYVRAIREKRNGRSIALIHDLESLRKGIEGVVTEHGEEDKIADGVVLKQFDAVICHNEHMRQYLISQGFAEDQLVNLEIFDYLCNYEGEKTEKNSTPSVAIAGNLADGKCRYIYDILDQDRNKNLTLHLYGNNFEESHIQERMIYHGSFLPEELPSQLEGDFGLVWDGMSAETCAGNTGEYLKYNNPHKTSLYLASGLPVIVWDQAAIADFVLENNVGITVSSLDSLDDVISNVSKEDYKIMCGNVYKNGEKIRSGYYFTTALNKCMVMLEKNEG